MTAEWPTEAREAVARAVATRCGEYTDVAVPSEYYVDADAVLAALAPHVQPRTDGWEWAQRRDTDGAILWPGDPEEDQRRGVATIPFRTLVRRRPAGEWEVAP